jgi:hypothetical protein
MVPAKGSSSVGAPFLLELNCEMMEVEMVRLCFASVFLALVLSSCSSQKTFKEDQCYSALYWPSELCEVVPRPPFPSARPKRFGKVEDDDD